MLGVTPEMAFFFILFSNCQSSVSQTKNLMGLSTAPLCPEVPAQAPVVGGPELTLLGLIFARPRGRAGDRYSP